MKITTIGLDLAKSVFQVHGVDATGQVVAQVASTVADAAILRSIPVFEKSRANHVITPKEMSADLKNSMSKAALPPLYRRLSETR
jgi:hypothetical protein